jgi:phosphonate transport system permease protein
VLLALFAGYAWVDVGLGAGDFFSERRARNLSRFLEEVRPHPLKAREFDLGAALEWAGDFIAEKGLTATLTTLAISVAAVVLAGALAICLCLLAARTLSNPEPYAPGPRPPHPVRRLGWWAVVTATRAFFVFIRALPEYVWAFLLLIALGPTPWTAVAALVLHNVGILGRLYAETIENLPPEAPAALRGLGARRLQIAATGVFPAVVPRFLLYFFYRWETCIREATVLGFLGIVSLGYFIEDARARNHYDEMMLLVMLGAALVIAGDLLSAFARRVVRRAG